MTDARTLYKAWVLDHNKHPRNEGALEDATHHVRKTNPLCGDRIDLFARLTDGTVTELRFEARGCAIAKASASLMCELLEGRHVEDGRALQTRLDALLRRGCEEPDETLDPLLGVRLFPGRTGCATLAWHAFGELTAGE